MKKYHIINLITAIILSYSCKKYGNGNISGKVYESDTNKPISAAKVVLYRWKNSPFDGSSASGAGKIELVDSVYTDSDGKYYLSLDKKRKYRYSIYCTSPNYYAGGGINQYTYELNSKKLEHDFWLDPFGYVKLRLIKTTPSHIYFYGGIGGNSFGTLIQEAPYDTILPANKVIPGNQVVWWYIESYDANSYRQMPDQNVNVTKRDTVLLTFQLD